MISKTIFQINNITGGKFDLGLSRGSASQGGDMNMKEKSNKHTSDNFNHISTKTDSNNSECQ